jgi:hypothetical protein
MHPTGECSYKHPLFLLFCFIFPISECFKTSDSIVITGDSRMRQLFNEFADLSKLHFIYEWDLESGKFKQYSKHNFICDLVKVY